MTSFLNEHTVEYGLTHYLNNVLIKHYKKVIPIYFWATREGSNISKECDKNQKIKIISVYARRPKIDFVDSAFITVKFNRILFEKAKYLNHFGIPVFAGVPLISNIFGYDINSDFMLFKLNPVRELVDHEVILKLNEKELTSSDLIEPISSKDIGILNEIIIKKCVEMTWTNAIDVIRAASKAKTEYNFNWFRQMGNYKPIYFLLKK